MIPATGPAGNESITAARTRPARCCALRRRAARPRPHNGQSGRRTDHQGRPHTPGLITAPPWPTPAAWSLPER